jgi:CCR4-NOT transcription complex subunit 6
LTPVREGRKKINIKKLDSNKNNKEINEKDSLQLNFNKSPNNRRANGKLNNYKNIKNKKNFIQNYKLKSINQFINKPNDEEIINQKNISTSSTNKTKPRLYHNSFNKLNHLKLSNTHDNNDSISLASISKIGTKVSTRGRSVQNSSKNKSNIHFPNKSVIKNKDKLLIELKKIFGEKIILCDDMYQNMNDTDKKNCINFLLEAIKEMININKIIERKNEGFKSINEEKEKKIKNDKNEIKELKKNIIKLNKIIKTNIQINRKLSQNVDNLKIQLDKEKKKNNEINKRGKSSCKNFNNIYGLKNKNENNSFSITTTKRDRYRSQERFRDTNDFINKKKKLNFNKNKDKDKENCEINNNNKRKNVINLNKIKIEDKNILSETIKENTENLNKDKNNTNIEGKNNLNEKFSENSETVNEKINNVDKNMNN